MLSWVFLVQRPRLKRAVEACGPLRRAVTPIRPTDRVRIDRASARFVSYAEKVRFIGSEIRVGDGLRLPSVRVGDGLRVPSVRVGDGLRVPSVRVGDGLRVRG